MMSVFGGRAAPQLEEAAPAHVVPGYRIGVPASVANYVKFNESVEVESESWRLEIPPGAGWLVRQVPHGAGLGLYRFGMGALMPVSSVMPATQSYDCWRGVEALAEPLRCATCGTVPEWFVNQPAQCVDCALVAETPRAIGEPLGSYEEVGDVLYALHRGQLRVDEGAQLVCLAPPARWARGSLDFRWGVTYSQRGLARRKDRIAPCVTLDQTDAPLLVYAAEPEPRAWWDWWQRLG